MKVSQLDTLALTRIIEDDLWDNELIDEVMKYGRIEAKQAQCPYRFAQHITYQIAPWNQRLVSLLSTPRWRLTTRYHGYIIGGKSDEGQDAPPLVEMGNVG